MKQKNYSYLIPELIKNYFKEVLCGDINAIEIRKHIARLFIREVILYNDKIVIAFNFTDNNLTKIIIYDNMNDIQKELELVDKLAVKSANQNVFKKSLTPPSWTQLNTYKYGKD